MATVLQTDFAWPDVAIERAVIEGAGHRLVTGPSAPSPAAAVEAMVAEHDPAAILTCWAEISAEAIGRPAALKIVQRLGVGLDNIAVDAAPRRAAPGSATCPTIASRKSRTTRWRWLMRGFAASSTSTAR